MNDMLLTFNLKLNQFHRHHFYSFILNGEKKTSGREKEREKEQEWKKYLCKEINRANPGLKVQLIDYYD